MDPNEAYRQFQAAIDDDDLPLATDLAMALLSWLDRGGFSPAGSKRGEIKAELLNFLGVNSDRTIHFSEGW